MINPNEVPHGFDGHWGQHYMLDPKRGDAGWYAVNSVNPRDCIPNYQLPGGGVSASQLTDLPKAIDRSILHLRQRMATSEAMVETLTKLKAVIDGWT